ncbi:hypothetical protein K8I28_07890 [bacterium]|nr:hypothetical protein [bacterium]
MIVRKFGDIRVGFTIETGVPNINFPAGFPIASENQTDPDIHFNVGVGVLKVVPPDTETSLQRGNTRAYGDKTRLVWTHPQMGTFIEVHPRAGTGSIFLPQWAWNRATDIMDQIILPALLPPFAARGMRGIHASAVEMNGMGIMFAGETGSGKTSCALQLVAEGGKLIADDMVFLSRDGDSHIIYGMGDGPRAFQDVWTRFPQWQANQLEPSGKRRLSPDHVPWSQSATLKRIILLDDSIDMTDNRQAKLIMKLLSLTYFDNIAASTLQMLSELLQRVPVQMEADIDTAASIARTVYKSTGSLSN